MPTCISCRHADLKAAGQLARHGFIHCPRLDPVGTYRPATVERICPIHSPAPIDQIEHRTTWLANERERFRRRVLQAHAKHHRSRQ